MCLLLEYHISNGCHIFIFSRLNTYSVFGKTKNQFQQIIQKYPEIGKMNVNESFIEILLSTSCVVTTDNNIQHNTDITN